MGEYVLKIAYMNAIFGIIWFIVACLFFVNTWIWNKRHSKYLQKIILLIPLLRCLYYINLSLVFFSCEDYWCKTIDARVAVAVIYASIIFTTFWTFLLISKGLYISVEKLDRKEELLYIMTILVSSILAGLAVKIFNQPSRLIIIILIIDFCPIAIFTKSLLEELILRHQNFLEANSKSMIPSILKKIQMIKQFLILVCFYFFQKLVMICFEIKLWKLYDFDDFYLEINILKEVFEIYAITHILYVFRSKEQACYFYIYEASESERLQPLI